MIPLRLPTRLILPNTSRPQVRDITARRHNYPYLTHTSWLSVQAARGTGLSAKENQSVAAIIIGDEVLEGKTLDTNSHFLARVCFDTGFELKRSIVIPDNLEVIADIVRKYSETYGLVFTSGGLGPTHDDVTYEAIAKGMDDELVLHQPTVDRMREISPELMKHFHEKRQRMAMLPSRSEVVFTPGLWVPLAIVDNVHVLPGIPTLFQQMLAHYASTTLAAMGLRFFRRLVRTTQRESEIAHTLEEIQNRCKPDGVKIGSYPHWDAQTGRQVIISVVGRDEKYVKVVWQELMKAVEGSPAELKEQHFPDVARQES